MELIAVELAVAEEEEAEAHLILEEVAGETPLWGVLALRLELLAVEQGS